MIPAKIQFELKLRQITQIALARNFKVNPSLISKVINRKCVSDRVMKGVAKAIGRNHKDVFPDYYCKSSRRSTSKAN